MYCVNPNFQDNPYTEYVQFCAWPHHFRCFGKYSYCVFNWIWYTNTHTHTHMDNSNFSWVVQLSTLYLHSDVSAVSGRIIDNKDLKVNFYLGNIKIVTCSLMISVAFVECRHLLLSKNSFTESVGCVGRHKHDVKSTFLAKDLIFINICKAKT